MAVVKLPPLFAFVVVLAVLLLAGATYKSAERATCLDELVSLPEPEGWASWAIVPRDGSTFAGGFRFEGESELAKYQLGFQNTRLTPPHACPDGGVSLDRWFTGAAAGQVPTIYRTVQDLSLHADPQHERYVVSAVSAMSGLAPPVFVAAFRVSTTPHRGFATPLDRDACYLLLAAALAAGASLVAARRARRFLKVGVYVALALILALGVDVVARAVATIQII